MSGPGVTLSSSPASTNRPGSWMAVSTQSPRARSSRVSRHELVGMPPARLGTKAREPVAEIGIAVPVPADLVVEEQVPAHRQVGIRQAIGDGIASPCQVLVQDAPGSFRALA